MSSLFFISNRSNTLVVDTYSNVLSFSFTIANLLLLLSKLGNKFPVGVSLAIFANIAFATAFMVIITAGFTPSSSTTVIFIQFISASSICPILKGLLSNVPKSTLIHPSSI